MAFVVVDLAESIAVSTETATDATNVSESALNDGSTSTESSNELREGMSAYKITHDIGFPVANLDTLSIQIFDGVMMDSASIVCYPYSSGDTDVVSGNQVGMAFNDNAAYDITDISALIPDLGDVGTEQISLRVVGVNGSGFRGRCTEIQIEFAESAASTSEQDSFRFEDDDGTESGSTSLDAQNTDITRGSADPFRVRVGGQFTGDPATMSATLEYKETSDADAEYRKVP